jgi:glycopeptide antibiotics resistance protein
LLNAIDKTYRYLLIYLMVMLLVIMLPVNNSDSELNQSWFLGIRMDYWMHVLAFTPWMFLKKTIHRNLTNNTWMLIGFLLAIALEGIQNFLPYRSFNLLDMAANAAGIGFSRMVYAFINKFA